MTETLPLTLLDAVRGMLLALLALLFAVLAIVAAAAHWQADLVEGRRRFGKTAADPARHRPHHRRQAFGSTKEEE